jgi:protein tyrosine phosphatase
MNSALPLITVSDGTFTLNEETAALISQIEEPIAVLCIAGMYRTGKSFILNQLLDRLHGYV